MKKNGQISDCSGAQQGEHIRARGILSYIVYIVYYKYTLLWNPIGDNESFLCFSLL